MIVAVLIAAALPAGRPNRATFGSRSAGRCSASAATRCCAESRSPATIFKWSTGSFGNQLLLEIARRDFASRSAVLVLQFGLLDRAASLPLVRRRGRHQPLGQFRADHAGRRDHFRRRRRRIEAGHPTIITATRAAKARSSSRRRIATVLINPIQERIQRWSENRFQQQPRPASRRFARAASATCARPRRWAKCSTRCWRGSSAAFARCEARRSSTARASRARVVDRRGRGMADSSTRGRISRPIMCDPPTACSRSACR